MAERARRGRLTDRVAPTGDAATYAARASRAYAAMQRAFGRRGGYRDDGPLLRRLAWAHLWPFSRAFVATLDLSGVAERIEFDADEAISARLGALERYWDARGEHPAYASNRAGSARGGHRFYDDNAWVGLGLVQLSRLRPGADRLARARDLLRFAAAGWDTGDGGIFWVEQGRGRGLVNHDRNTVSTAPNAQLALHLAELRAAPADAPVGAEAMYRWLLQTLDCGGDGTGLFWDKVCGDGSIDRALWSYNQGSMVGLNVLLARRGGNGSVNYLKRAETIADKALRLYADEGYARQPAAFNAIFFRNLLLLHVETESGALRERILAAMRAYAEELWDLRRDRHDLFHLPRPSLLGQSAAVQIMALLAWDPADYPLLA